MSTGIGEIDAIQKDVTELKVSVAGMKPYVMQIPEIAKSLSVLAEIMPKLQANMEDHHRIHQRLDGVEDYTGTIEGRLHSIELEHAVCMARQKIEDAEDQNSIWSTTKKSIVPVIVLAVLAFAVWLAAAHLPEYLASPAKKEAGK